MFKVDTPYLIFAQLCNICATCFRSLIDRSYRITVNKNGHRPVYMRRGWKSPLQINYWLRGSIHAYSRLSGTWCIRSIVVADNSLTARAHECCTWCIQSHRRNSFNYYTRPSDAPGICTSCTRRRTYLVRVNNDKNPCYAIPDRASRARALPWAIIQDTHCDHKVRSDAVLFVARKGLFMNDVILLAHIYTTKYTYSILCK